MKPSKDIIVWVGIIICALMLTIQMLYTMPSHKHQLIWDNLTKTQKQMAGLIYDRTSKKGYGLTMIALAWQESRLGQALENKADPSCGVIHILLPTYFALYKQQDTPQKRDEICKILKTHHYIAIDTALEVFEHFINYHTPKNKKLTIQDAAEIYKRAIQSFNCGYRVNTKTCLNYYSDVMAHIKQLEKIPIATIRGGL